MAPDKIYLNRIHPEPYWFNDKQVDSDIEYICKDALIEILQGYSHPLTKLVMQEIIDKINSL